MIALKIKHFETSEVKYPTLDRDLAKFLTAYWYGRTKALYDEYVLSKKKKDFLSYVNSYSVFIRALYASGVHEEELVKFVRDFFTHYFDYTLKNRSKLKKLQSKGHCLPFIILLYSFQTLNDLNEKAEILINEILGLKRIEDYDVETWFKVLSGKHDFEKENVSDPILIALIDNDLSAFEYNVTLVIDQSMNRALRVAKNNENSDNFLARSAGFFDYSLAILKSGYLNIFQNFNSQK